MEGFFCCVLSIIFPAMVLMMNNSGCVLNTVVIKAVFI